MYSHRGYHLRVGWYQDAVDRRYVISPSRVCVSSEGVDVMCRLGPRRHALMDRQTEAKLIYSNQVPNAISIISYTIIIILLQNGVY